MTIQSTWDANKSSIRSAVDPAFGDGAAMSLTVSAFAEGCCSENSRRQNGVLIFGVSLYPEVAKRHLRAPSEAKRRERQARPTLRHNNEVFSFLRRGRAKLPYRRLFGRSAL